MIDASTIVAAALKRDGIPRQAILKARRTDVIALSPAVESEIRQVLARPKFARHLSNADREEIIALITDAAIRVLPALTVADSRDAKDNKYLELAGSIAADCIISSDRDLLDLDSWRGIRILSAREFLEAW